MEQPIQKTAKCVRDWKVETSATWKLEPKHGNMEWIDSSGNFDKSKCIDLLRTSMFSNHHDPNCIVCVHTFAEKMAEDACDFCYQCTNQLSICTLYLPWFRTSSCLTEVNITATMLDWCCRNKHAICFWTSSRYINPKSSATTSTLRGHQIPRSEITTLKEAVGWPSSHGITKELRLHLHRNPCLLGGMEPLRHVKPCKSWDVPSSSSSHRQDYWISVAGSQ